MDRTPAEQVAGPDRLPQLTEYEGLRGHTTTLGEDPAD